jgi:hypothetical protein
VPRPPQSRPFAVLVHFQVAVDKVAWQIGLLGIATGNEVQPDTVNAESVSPINLEDFRGVSGVSAPAADSRPQLAPRFSLRRAKATEEFSALQLGDPQAARRAFQAAYGLSPMTLLSTKPPAYNRTISSFSRRSWD